MRKKMIDTVSGARYAIFEDGRIERAGTAHISYSLHQYKEGKLRDVDTFDDVEPGDRVCWLGVEGDDVEPITSSVVREVTVVADTDGACPRCGGDGCASCSAMHGEWSTDEGE